MIRRNTRAAVVACSLTLLFVPIAGCSAAPDDAEGEQLASSDSDLSTADAIARASLWVGAKLHYCQAANHQRDYDSACSSVCNRTNNSKWDPYRSDCSGLVSWAWGLPAPGRVTGQFAPFQNDITHAIPASSLQPGDAVNNSHHIMLFKGWTSGHSQARFIEEPGCSSSTPYAHEFTSNVSLSGNSIHVSWNGDTFTAIRYGKLTTPAPPPPPPPAPPPNAAPRGYLDVADCTTIAGWAQDTDKPSATVGVTITIDGPSTKAGVTKLTTTADLSRSDLCGPLGSCKHAFSVKVPAALADGKTHSIYAYGIDATGGTTKLLTNAPKNITCTPPAPPAPPSSPTPPPSGTDAGGPASIPPSADAGAPAPSGADASDPVLPGNAPTSTEPEGEESADPAAESEPSGDPGWATSDPGAASDGGCAAAPRTPGSGDAGLFLASFALFLVARGRRRA